MKRISALFFSLCAALALTLPALADIAVDPAVEPVARTSPVWLWLAVGAALLLAAVVIVASVRRRGKKK